MRIVASATLALLLAFSPTALIAQDAAKAPAKKSAAKSSAPGTKVCSHKFPSGEKRTWTCKKEEPCCAWDAISYVKCGSTITGCL